MLFLPQKRKSRRISGYTGSDIDKDKKHKFQHLAALVTRYITGSDLSGNVELREHYMVSIQMKEVITAGKMYFIGGKTNDPLHSHLHTIAARLQPEMGQNKGRDLFQLLCCCVTSYNRAPKCD